MTTSRFDTKKLPVEYDPSRPRRASSNFLVPIKDDTGVSFLGLKSKRCHAQGQIVYIGAAVSAAEVFEKLVESGRMNEGVEANLETIQAYLQMLQDFKIGNILRIESTVEHECGFRLVKVADHEPFEQKKLP